MASMYGTSDGQMICLKLFDTFV